MTFTASDNYYVATAAPAPARPALCGDVDCDVAIVGAGFTGLSAALELAERGYDVAVIEGARIAFGASGRNGGQVNTGYRKGVAELAAMVGPEETKRLWTLSEEAKRIIRERVQRHAIACDLKSGSLYAGLKPADLVDIEAELEAQRSIVGYCHGTPIDKAGMAERLGTEIYLGGLADAGAHHLHPLNYALGLARAVEAAGARIFEGTRARRIAPDGHRVETEAGVLRARFTLVCCNGYLGRLMPALAPKILPISNYIVATEPLGAARARTIIRDDIAVCDSKFVVNYYRLSADKRLLFGGGEVYGRRDPRDIRAFVRGYMLKVYPQLADAKIEFGWGGRLAITLSRLPHVGRLGKDLYFAQGFSGQGVALTGMAGRLMAEAIAGSAERFDVWARLPHRNFPGGRLLRHPAQILGMLYFSLRDRL